MTGPQLGLAEAAKACGVSESTLRRKREDLKELGAVQGPKGWQIPFTALIELGLMDRTTAPEAVEAPRAPAGAVVGGFMPAPDDGVMAALKERLAAAEQRAAVAEAVAAERQRIIDAQASHLRMLEAPKDTPKQRENLNPDLEDSVKHPQSSAQAQQQDEPKPAKRRWWQYFS